MSKEDKKNIKKQPGEKSLKLPFIVYADLECMFQKLDTCQNDPKKYFTKKKKLSICLQVTHALCVVDSIS